MQIYAERRKISHAKRKCSINVWLFQVKGDKKARGVEYALLRGLVVADNYRLTDVLIYRFNDFMSSLLQIKPLIIQLWSMPRK